MAKNFVYVGSWLDDNKNNGGLRLYEQDSMTGELKFVEEYVKDLAVGSLCISPDRKYLYALDEIKRKPGRISCGGSVYAFAIDQDSGRLAYINSIPTAGAFPCYITIDSTGRYLLAVNYGSEDVTIRSVQDDNGSYVLQHSFDEASAVVIRTGNNGRLDGIADLVRIEGTPSKAYEYFQSSPHPHSINIDPSDDFALITDRGCDQLIMYRLDRSSGKLARADILRTKNGVGPRNSVFHPILPYFYVACELMPYVIVCRYDRQTGRIYEPEYIPTVPENEIPENFDNFFDKPHPADICMHPGGRYLFVTNRGSDTVAIYSVDGSDGSLSLAGFSASGGVWPWACRFDTAGKFFYTGNKNDGKVAAFSFDDKSGRLNKLDHCVMIERPVCIRTLMVE